MYVARFVLIRTSTSYQVPNTKYQLASGNYGDAVVASRRITPARLPGIPAPFHVSMKSEVARSVQDLLSLIPLALLPRRLLLYKLDNNVLVPTCM